MGRHVIPIEAQISPEPMSGCWLWLGAVGSTGYGHVIRRKRTIRAHRYVYEAFRSAIPDGHDLHHACGVPLCVNPDHMKTLTPQEHIKITLPNGGPGRGHKRARLN